MLPEQFLNRMKQMLGDEFPAFLESYEQDKYQALRINPQKTTISSFMEKSPFSLKQALTIIVKTNTFFTM